MDDAKQLTSRIRTARENDVNQSFTYHGWVLPEYKCLCMTLPKVACTTVKVALYHLAGKSVQENPNDVHGLDRGLFLARYSTKEIVEMLTSTEWVKFCFVRNPYHRLLSAYKSKIGNTRDTQYLWLQDVIRDEFNYPAGDGNHRAMVTFADFVHFLSDCRATVRYELKPDAIYDGHFNAQNRILMQDLINYDFIGRFENFADDFKAILRRLGAPEETVALASERRNATVRVPLTTAYSRELAALVYNMYRDDFEAFDYGRASWMFES